jgi:flagellar hook-length control protein FliK
MLAYNLHLEKTAYMPDLSNQGLKRQTQGDSSFFDLLQTEIKAKQSEETKEPRDGQKITTESQKTQIKTGENLEERDVPVAKNNESESKAAQEQAQVKEFEEDSLFIDRGLQEKAIADSEFIDLNALDEKISPKNVNESLSLENESKMPLVLEDLNEVSEELVDLNDAQLAYLLKEARSEDEVDISQDSHIHASLESLFFDESSSSLKDISKDDEEALLQRLLTGAVDLSLLQDDFSDAALEAEDSKTLGVQNAEKMLFGSENAIISVVDERTSSKEAKKTDQFVKSIQFETDGKTANVLMSLPSQAEAVGFGSEKESANHFQTMLANELKNSATDLVKTGSIILKDNNSGLINLFLKPEALGDVKIRLNISDTLISAKIIVDSQEALNAFKDSIGALKQAFEQGGFDTGSFDLSWSGQGGSGQEKNEHNAKAHFYSDALPELVQDELESNERILALMKNAIQYGTSIVNVIA